MSYEQMTEDRARALEQEPESEQLPAYSEAVKGQPSVQISEKDIPQKQSKKSGKMSTFKSIITGDCQKHNPRLRDPTSRYTVKEVEAKPDLANPSRSSSSKSSTLKSILTGDCQKHNPRLRDPQRDPRYAYATEPNSKTSAPRSQSSASSVSSSSPKSSTIKSILTGDVHKYHPMYRLEESLNGPQERFFC